MGGAFIAEGLASDCCRAVAECADAPQIVQNLTPGTSLAPHFEHSGSCDAETGIGFTSVIKTCPHLPQKWASGLSWLPHWVQKFIIVLL